MRRRRGRKVGRIWIGAHTRAFSFFGGVPNIVVPDNLNSGVTLAHRYEPDLNPTYQDMATHYGVAVVPTRARKPRDKAKVEVGVQIVERTLLAALRHRQCFSLAELNAAIAELLIRLNLRPFKKLPGSRQSQFEAIDRPALKPLPSTPYEYAAWKQARVHIGLSHRGRAPLLLRAASSRETTTRCSCDGIHHRVLPSGPTRGLSSPCQSTRAADHHHRADARAASALGPVLTRAMTALGREDRPRDRRPHHPSLRLNDPTRSRVTVPASGSCGWPKATAIND